MEWTIGPVDYFFEPFYRGGGGRPLVLREGWDAVYQYSGRNSRHTVVTVGGAEDELLVSREGWEVDVLVTVTDLWAVH